MSDAMHSEVRMRHTASWNSSPAPHVSTIFQSNLSQAPIRACAIPDPVFSMDDNIRVVDVLFFEIGWWGREVGQIVVDSIEIIIHT